jgi:hypothetical protein
LGVGRQRQFEFAVGEFNEEACMDEVVHISREAFLAFARFRELVRGFPKGRLKGRFNRGGLGWLGGS